MGLLADLFVGILAGWLAGLIRRGEGYGLLGNLVVGVLGAFAGDLAFRLIGLHAHGFLGTLATAAAGAMGLLFLFGLVRGRKG